MPSLLDNDAVLVVRIEGADQPVRHTNALLLGVKDGGGAMLHRRSEAGRYLPVARGRVDWLGAGELLALGTGPQPFGQALLVELRSLPDAPGVTRTFGDRLLFDNETVRVYEEILGPSQVRPMHSHAPRLIVPLTDAHIAQRFPGGEVREERVPAGSVHWAAHVVTHEIRNVGLAPFWAICVEHI